ncbi:MAG: glycosyltransferase family 4 protein [Patescibacteria group bacterium]
MPTTGKKILIFSLAYFPVEGGAEIAVKEITNRISNAEFDLITLRFNKIHSVQEKIGNVNVFRLDSSKTLFPFKAFLFASKLHKKYKYDLIWAIMANWAGLAAMFFKYRFPKVPYLLTLQEGDSLDFIKRKVRFIWPIFRKIFTKADLIQAISNFLGNFAKSVGYKGRIEIVPNGVDVEKFAESAFPAHGQASGNSREKPIRLITTSRLVKKNAVGDIIETLKYLPENVSLKILGTGPLEIDCKLQIENWKLEGRVEMLGHVDYNDIPRHLHQSDIFIRPSVSEGFGSSFIEAMAADLPVIATNVGGIPDFLKDYETGLFCEVNNPKSIAEKIIEYIHNPELVSRVVKNARAMVEKKYDWNLVAKQMNAIFDKLDA